MKYLGMLISSIGVLLIVLVNLYYNSIHLDIKKIENYIFETNAIIDDLVKEREVVLNNQENYLKRLKNIKNGLKNSKTSILVDKYKTFKIKSVENLENTIKNNNNIYLKEVNKYNKLSEKELKKLLKKEVFKVTYIPKNSYNL